MKNYNEDDLFKHLEQAREFILSLSQSVYFPICFVFSSSSFCFYLSIGGGFVGASGLGWALRVCVCARSRIVYRTHLRHIKLLVSAGLLPP